MSLINIFGVDEVKLVIGAILLDDLDKSDGPKHLLGLGYDVESPLVQLAARTISEMCNSGKSVHLHFMREVLLAKKIEASAKVAWAAWKKDKVLPARNRPCLCGSQKKFKYCCMKKVEDVTRN